MKRIERTLGTLVLILTVLLSNRGLWLCLTDVSDPLSFCDYNYPGQELILYFFTSCFAIWLVVQSGKGKVFVSRWRKNILILAFIALAIVSILWSVYRISTLYLLLILIFSTILAAFLGTYFSSEYLLLLLAVTGGTIVVISGILSVIFPHAVIMGPPHDGSWRGVYWHKNFTGSLMAFWNAIFLLYGLYSLWAAKRMQVYASGFFYVLSLIFMIVSQSAAGIVTGAGLNLIIIVALLWNKLKSRLTKQHYILLGCAVLVLIILGITNLDFFFRMVNREASLTGRLPLWTYLVKTIVIQRPYFGYGLSAIWNVRGFRNQTTLIQGWPFTITNGHNGFLDILLGLGLVGLILAILLFTVAFYRSVKFFILDNKIENLLPLVIILYFFLANMSISLFLGIESFHWVLFTVAIFLVTPTAHDKN